MKTEERSIKELLILLRDRLESTIKSDCEIGGLCSTIYVLWCETHEMSEKEALLLDHYLRVNRPKGADERRIKYRGQYDGDGFTLERHWWKPRAIKPRINWLNKQIDKL